MYLVVSYWEPLPGREAEFEKNGPQVGAMLRQQPGVVFMEGFKSGKRVVFRARLSGREDLPCLNRRPQGAIRPSPEGVPRRRVSPLDQLRARGDFAARMTKWPRVSEQCFLL